MASRFEYKEKLIEQMGKIMRRMRQKAYFFEEGKRGERKETFGFKSAFAPKKVSSKRLAAMRAEFLINAEVA